MLACDLVVAASADALRTVQARPHPRARQHARDPGRRVAAQSRTPSLKVAALLEKLRVRRRRRSRRDAWTRRRSPRSSWATRSSSNILALGYAWQRGLVPVSLAALHARDRAERRRRRQRTSAAFALGPAAPPPTRSAVPRLLARAATPAPTRTAKTLDELVERRRALPHRLPGRRPTPQRYRRRRGRPGSRARGRRCGADRPAA